jgi:hypothetical protein
MIRAIYVVCQIAAAALALSLGIDGTWPWQAVGTIILSSIGGLGWCLIAFYAHSD